MGKKSQKELCNIYNTHNFTSKNKNIKPQIEQGVILWYLYILLGKNKEHLKVKAENIEHSGSWRSTKPPLFTHWYVLLNLFISSMWMMCLGGMHAPHMCGGQRSTEWSQFSYSTFAWILWIVLACFHSLSHFIRSLTDILNLFSFCSLWYLYAHSWQGLNAHTVPFNYWQSSPRNIQKQSIRKIHLENTYHIPCYNSQ